MDKSTKALRLAATFVIGNLLIVILSSCGTTHNTQADETVTVLADTQVYNERPEIESLWYGNLESNQRNGEPPPNQRAGLYYRLVGEEAAYDMYASKIIPELEAFLGQQVMVKGKLLMPSGPGSDLLGEELWPATVHSVQQGEPNILPCATSESQPDAKFHLKLAEWLNTRPGGETESIIITFCEYLDLPQNPDPDEIRDLRGPTFAMLTEELRQYGASVTNTFWLINGITVEVQLKNLRDIAERGDVDYLEPIEDGSSPP